MSIFWALRVALAMLAAFLHMAHSMRVDPERIWARLRIEAEAEESAESKAEIGRNRRQLVGGGSPKEETIQVTAPLFSSRLFDFGPTAGDKELSSSGGLDSAKKLSLSKPVHFFGQQHSAIWVFSNGGLGFEQTGRQYRANILTSATKMIAPFWNRNDLRNGGKIYYREVTSGRVLERGQSEIRYQYDSEVKVHSAVLATFEKMQPVGTDPLPDENTNTFQVALFITSNGTFANFIYSNIGWTQGAEAGFNAGDGVNFFALPTSGTGNIMYLEDYGNTGIPGEWMFVLGADRIQRCKAGIKGDTCDEACSPGEWGPDCVRCCHCADEKAGCHEATGECKQGGCAKCWAGQNCQQREVGAQCAANGQRQCGQNAMPQTEMNRCGEPQHRCECLSGFEGDPYAGCNDIDECSRPNTCHQKAQCTNTPGRFFCQCLDGFQGDGISECVASFLYPFEQSHRLPNDRHGRVEWQLKHPLRIFGRMRESLWLTSNGLILVKGAKNVPMKSGEKHALDGMDVQGVAPFYAPIDLAQQGQIYVEETTDPRILAKASQLINDQLGNGGEKQFTANHALLVTYVNVSLGHRQQSPTQMPLNTFQTILIGGRDRLKLGNSPMTFVQFLYRDIQWSEDAEAGIMAPDKANSILLPGSGTEGIELLSQLSNVRSQGVWLYRIDGAAPSACIQPDLQPPYCDARNSQPAIVQPNRSPPPSTEHSSPSPQTTLAPTTTVDVPISPSATTTSQQSFGFEGEEEGEEEQQQIVPQNIRPSLPQFPRVEQNGWVPVGGGQGQNGGQKQTVGGKKPAIVQIHSREFEEMPPDAFDDGTVSRATTKAAEEEDSEIREIIPSLIVPELVKPLPPRVDQPQPTVAPSTRISSVESSTQQRQPQRPQIQIDQQPPELPTTSSNLPISTQTIPPTSTTKEAEIRPSEEDGNEKGEGDEPMRPILPGGGNEGGQIPSGTTIDDSEAIVTEQTMPLSTIEVEEATTTSGNPQQPFFVFNSTKSKAIFTTKKTFLEKTTTDVPKMKPENADGDDPLLMDWEQQGTLLDGASGQAGNTELSIVVPIAIVLVWLVVLVIVAVFLCCRRRQTQERLRTLYGPAYQIRPVYTMRNFKGPNGFGGSSPEASYEEHLEKAAQRLSAELAYNPNPLWAGPGRYSLYGSYWNISPEGSAAGRINGHSSAKQRASAIGGGAGGDICSPRSQESGSGQPTNNGGGMFGNYVQQMGRPNGNGTSAVNGDRESSEYFGTAQRNSAAAVGSRFNGRH